MAKNYRTEFKNFIEDIRVFKKAISEKCTEDDELYQLFIKPTLSRKINVGDFKKVVQSVQNEVFDDDKDIKQLFVAADENVGDPWAWYRMVHLFAKLMIETNPGGKEPQHKWPAPEIIRKDLVMAIKKSPNAKREALIFAMKKRCPKRYGKIPDSTLIRQITALGLSVKNIKRELSEH